MVKAFEISPAYMKHEGFKVVFDNGWTVSVQWHEITNSDRGLTTCELWAWDSKDNAYGEPVDSATPEDMLNYMCKINSFDS